MCGPERISEAEVSDYLPLWSYIMAKTKPEIIADLKTYITANGGDFKAWFVGVCNDAANRLSTVHKVDPKLDKWVFRTAPSPAIAKELEYYFVKILGAEGAATAAEGGGDKIYAYRMSERTNP